MSEHKILLNWNWSEATLMWFRLFYTSTSVLYTQYTHIFMFDDENGYIFVSISLSFELLSSSFIQNPP